MRAALLDEGGRALRVGTLPDPRPGPGEVVLRVRAAGICGTDLGFIDGLKMPPGVRFPLVLGHEVAGEVVEVGQGGHPWRPGDRVLVNPFVACGRCPVCRVGRRSICGNGSSLGLQRPGGFAEYLAVPAANLHALPQHLSLAVGAIIPDAVSTAYHALVTRGGLGAGESVAIFGAGGVGTHGILLAKLLGAAPLLVMVRRQEVAARVRAMGADAVLLADQPNPVKEIRRLAGRGGVDLAVDFIGRPESLRAALASTRLGGRAVVVGVSDSPVTLTGSSTLVRTEVDLRGAFGADPAEIDAVLDLARTGRLDLRDSISREFPLEAIGEALELLRSRAGDIVRLVITP